MRMLTVMAFSAVAGAGLMALSSCATLNESQCQVADWRQLGFTNGTQGQPVSYVDRHRDACARYGIVVDAASWRAGWAQGIRTYCTPFNGLEAGRDGRFNRNACPADLAQGFNQSYRVGRNVYDARRRRDDIERDIDVLITELGGAETPEQRREIRLRIDVRRAALFNAGVDVRRAERQADRFQLRLAGQ